MSIDDPAKILSTLQGLTAGQKRLPTQAATLSDNGETLTASDGTVMAARTKLTMTFDDKSCSYTAAAVVLQILDPDQKLVTYRSACKKYQVTDPIGSADRPVVLGFFFGVDDDNEDKAASQDAATETAAAAAPEVADKAAAQGGDSKRESSRKEHRHKQSSKDHHHHHRRDKDKRKKDHRSSSKHRDEGSEKRKKAKTATVTNEELFGNLDDMVGKRTTDPASASLEADKEAITAALSAEGFDVTPELLEEYRETTQHLLANEIPVGDSASILRAANPRKDLSRVLEIFNETVNPKKSKPSSAAKAATKSAAKSHLVGKKPVIVIPKGMTAPLTMLNAHDFLSKGRYVPRDVLLKQQRESGARRGNPATTFTRQVGGTAAMTHPGLVEYEITDNPKRLLGTDPKEWERIVAVFVLGQKWQFADWFFDYSNPVKLFTKVFGFFVSLEGDKLPEEVQGWAVRRAKLNRDKRGLDSVTSAAFWNGLDEFMSVHKRELLPQRAEE